MCRDELLPHRGRGKVDCIMPSPFRAKSSCLSGAPNSGTGGGLCVLILKMNHTFHAVSNACWKDSTAIAAAFEKQTPRQRCYCSITRNYIALIINLFSVTSSKSVHHGASSHLYRHTNKYTFHQRNVYYIGTLCELEQLAIQTRI